MLVMSWSHSSCLILHSEMRKTKSFLSAQIFRMRSRRSSRASLGLQRDLVDIVTVLYSMIEAARRDKLSRPARIQQGNKAHLPLSFYLRCGLGTSPVSHSLNMPFFCTDKNRKTLIGKFKQFLRVRKADLIRLYRAAAHDPQVPGVFYKAERYACWRAQRTPSQWVSLRLHCTAPGTCRDRILLNDSEVTV